jgi:2-polyprenyl-6-hydroxyphenyl methylase/3-demethylubiquinone-9 3-methyltransferase
MENAKKNYTDQTTDSEEIRHFDTIGGDWWDEQGTFRALHRLTPTRVRYIRQHIARFRGNTHSTPSAALPLSGIKAVDIGCGGGLLAEPLARLGAEVTGIDMSTVAIAAAKDHADSMGLDIRYLHSSAEQLAAEGTGYDLVIASEVIEHVSDRVAFLSAMAALGRGGKLPAIAVITTISRNVIATALAKYAAEYLLRLAPPGTHEACKFVSPQTLRAEAKAAGIHLDDITGIRPSIREGFALGGPPIINYAAAGLIHQDI